MNELNAAMTVIGAGSYGTALAITLARNGHHVVLWGHDPKHIATLQNDRCNAAFLPDVSFPDTLHLESDLSTALAAVAIFWLSFRATYLVRFCARLSR
ncbi:Glycerol-3-phosphate dehydrogenase [NAD(P)+] [Raoultella terrigena]|uniref:Glycerol-3-phosphate dehydrogenase [NAD(P)+] n=1 Tax=Raoultella terrigena TaxID=577 RepID=A0A4V6YW48_RAOTE|nr:Glycerol-3-phosphate dehydrogenase [NAD(P)+] [Raoultella terrigena]